MPVYIGSEDQEQETFIRWLELKKLPHTAIPNSTYTTSWKQKAKNKRMGLKRGFPDIVVCVAGRVVAVEMKRTKGGVVSPYQKEWIETLNKHGLETRVCKGAGEAIEFIESWLKVVV